VQIIRRDVAVKQTFTQIGQSIGIIIYTFEQYGLIKDFKAGIDKQLRGMLKFSVDFIGMIYMQDYDGA